MIFKQKRPGKDEKIFTLYKFRTMRTDAPKDMPTHMLNNAESYITKIGGFLRKTRGAIISMVTVLTVLPAFLIVFDKIICKTTANMRRLSNKINILK